MIDPQLVGTKTELISILVTREEVRAYVEAVGEPNGIFYDLDIAKNAGFSDLVIPVTYPAVFWQHIEIPWLTTQKIPIIQTEQKFSYNEPLIANVTYKCQITLIKVRTIKNRQFLKHRLDVLQSNKTNKVLAISDTTIVLLLK